MAIGQTGTKVLGRAFGQPQQRDDGNIGNSGDAIKQLMANQKAGIKLGGTARRSGGTAPSSKQAKFETNLQTPTTYEVRNAERYLESDEGKETSLGALEQQGYVVPEDMQKHYAGGSPTGEAITKDGRIINVDKNDIQEHTLTRINEDGTEEHKVIKSYGYKDKSEVFANRQSILREAALDYATGAGFSQDQAEAWFTKNYEKYHDDVKGGESQTWKQLIQSVQVRDVNADTLSDFYGNASAGDYSPQQTNAAAIKAYRTAYRTTARQAPVVDRGLVSTKETEVKDKVDIGGLEANKVAMSPANVLMKPVGKIKGTDRFIIAENTGEATKGVVSEGFKMNLISHADTEGNRAYGTSFNQADVYLHLNERGITSPLNPKDSQNQNDAFDTLVELGVINNFNPEDSREGRQMLEDSVNFLNEKILPQAMTYAQGLTKVEQDVLKEFHASPANKNLRNKYSQLHHRKGMLLDNFLSETDIGKELMMNSDGLFNTDSIQTLDSDEPFNPQNPYSIDTMVDTLASLSSRDERQRFINRNLKESLTPKGQRWMNRLNNNLSLVLKRVDGNISEIGSQLGRRTITKPLQAGPTFGNKVTMFFTDNTRDVSYSKKSNAWTGDEESDDYNIVSGLDAMQNHWAQVESLNFAADNVEVSKTEFITTVLNKASKSEAFKEKLQRRLNLSDPQIDSLISTIPELTEFELDREIENIIDMKLQPSTEDEEETPQVKTVKTPVSVVETDKVERYMPPVLRR